MNLIKTSCSFAWLEFKALRFYPSSFALSIIKSFVGVGMWFFISVFLQEYSTDALSEYGGNFIAYMVIGVIFFQNAAGVLTLPFKSLSTAFWDKRLEVYNSSDNGIWAYVLGRFIWYFIYNIVIQSSVLFVAVFVVKVGINTNFSILIAIIFYILFIAISFGIGLIGASTFFTLEVKQGREPITWAMDILARIFSGVYYPLTIIPQSIRFVSLLLPHTYALQGIRLVMINGYGLNNLKVRESLIILIVFTVVSLVSGIRLFNKSLRHAEKRNGVGMVV